MSGKPQFTIYGHNSGPNPWKVVNILNELGLSFEWIGLDFNKGEHKAEKYLAINPNGRVPALVDHQNKDFTVWESGAIILYLAAKYDPQNKIHTGDFETDTLATQWLMFQMSGQGPYFGQAAWFTFYHSEKLPSVIERYNKEALRVVGVLERGLEGKDYLVGNRLTYADLSFISWNNFVLYGIEGVKEDFAANKFPQVKKWHEKLVARDAWKKTMELKDQVTKESEAKK